MSPNPNQQAAINAHERNVVVVAGPGSGKTFVLTNAIKTRLALGANPLEVAVITYTNAAAHEFTQRLGQQLGFCGTLHGFCFRLLQQYGKELGYRPGSISILPQDEQEKMLVAIANEFGARGIGKTKLLARDPHAEIERVWKEYYFRLRANNLVDYDSILAHGLLLVGRASNFAQLFVDEGQDSADIDWEIYKAFPALWKFIVGDPDQCCFSFRGANPRRLVEKMVDPEWRAIVLETNYRSDTEICRVASNLIVHNTNRVHKMVRPSSRFPGEVHLTRFTNDMEELMMLIGKIQRWQAEGSSVAVLYRTNHLAAQARNFLQTNGVRVQRDKTLDMPRDFGRALVLVSLCVSPGNDILAEKYLSFDYEPATIARMKNQALAQEKTIAEVAISRLEFPKNLGGLLKFLAVNEISEPSVALIRQRIDLLHPDAELPDLLSDLYAHKDWNRASEEDGCYVGTMHSAKGREFDVVFLPAFEENCIPSGRCSITPMENDSELEEERRLAFVAITRARHQLYVSFSDVRKPKWGNPVQCVSSRFIKEMEL